VGRRAAESAGLRVLGWDARIGWKGPHGVDLSLVGRDLGRRRHAEFGTRAIAAKSSGASTGRSHGDSEPPTGFGWPAGAIALLAAWAAFARPAQAASPAASREYDLKRSSSSFHPVRHLARGGVRRPAAPITIGILGDDPFGGSLAEVVDDEVVRNRRLVVEHFAASRM